MDFKINKKISALIITLNEEIHIRELLNSLNFVDEIVVVDSFSTDNTKFICESFINVKFYQNRFDNFTSQRNFAIAQAKNDWILFLDADERLTPELKNEILYTLDNNNDKHTAFLFYRTFMFENKVLNFSGWQTDKIFRLFNKNFANYTSERLVHEKLKVEGSIGILKSKLIHYSYSDFKSYKSKMINYGKLKAKEKYNNKYKPNLAIINFHPIYNFLYNYLIRLGFIDGKKGVIICFLNAYSVYIRYEELNKLWKLK
jgi:glycosyltransferase involved in cell wall biosynthesis